MRSEPGPNCLISGGEPVVPRLGRVAVAALDPDREIPAQDQGPGPGSQFQNPVADGQRVLGDGTRQVPVHQEVLAAQLGGMDSVRAEQGLDGGLGPRDAHPETCRLPELIVDATGCTGPI